MSSNAKRARRRSPGEGSVFEYKLANGTVRYGIKFLAEVNGVRKPVLRRRDPAGNPWTTRTAASASLRDAMTKVDRNEWTEPSKQPLGVYLDQWLDGLRLAPSTLASYRKNVRLHITPYLGTVPLVSLTGPRITAHYRQLEQTGRADHKAGTGLSARTVRYIHTILREALQAAVDSDLLTRNPADRAEPPSAKQAKAPEMHPWNRDQLRAFLDWSSATSALHVAWVLLVMTGMRRGELLALRWRDVDLTAGTVSVRRSVGVIKAKGKKERLEEGQTKTNRPRVIDLDEATVALLKTYKAGRGSLALALARDEALVFGTEEGNWLHPERFSRKFGRELVRCGKALGDAAPLAIRLHDLRHTHATLLLQAGTPVKVVSERLGHANPTITLTVYAHVMPGMQREAAEKFASIVAGA